MPSDGTTCAVPGTDSATITRTSAGCISFSDPDDELCKIALKQGSGEGSCTVRHVAGETSGDLCTGADSISNIQFEYHCAECPADGDGTIPPGEVECTYDITPTFSKFCCDEVAGCVSGLVTDCPVTANLVGSSCATQTETLTASDNCFSFDIECGCTPQSVEFYAGTDTTGELLTTLDPSGDLDCICDQTTTCKYDVEDTALPPLGQQKTFTCDGVSITVETTKENDGTPSCFKLVSASDPVFQFEVKGSDDSNVYASETECGGTSQSDFEASEFCSPIAGRSGKEAAVSWWKVTVCADENYWDCLVE